MKRTLALVGLVLFSFRLLAADVFTHELRKHPKGDRSCDGLAQELGAKFAEAAAVELYSVGVKSETDTACDLRFGYLAEKRVETTQSEDRGSFSSDPYQAAYPSADSCEQALAAEQQLLEAQTGLSAWIAYCYREDRLISWQKYVPFVEAVGASDTRLYKTASTVWVRPSQDWKDFTRDLIAEIKTSQPLKLATVSYNPGVMSGDRELILRFYGDRRRWLRVEGFAEHADPEVCDEQLLRIRPLLRKAKQPPALVYCGERFPKKYQLGVASLEADILSGSAIRSTEDPKQFATLAQCLDNLDAVESFYREKLGRPVLAGFCGGTRYFQITLFEDSRPASL